MADKMAEQMSKSSGRVLTWADESGYWRENFSSRPYATADRGFDQYEPAYRYGYESATKHRGRQWSEVEPELRTGWDRYEHRGSVRSTWEEVKDAVKDAWERATR
jgi:hypothetical protein